MTTMSASLKSISAGLLFGIGLTLAGMTNPAKVLGFLDIFGAWDPTLAFVMGGAIIVMTPAWFILRARKAPVPEPLNRTLNQRGIDRQLVGGAVLFGAGWGLVGLCPGPAIAALTFGGTPVAVFTLSMLVGMILYRLIGRQRTPAFS